ncbi:MAG: hypothetical protein JKY96_05220 [Phycisphaerales bacterium]|nr:hypothetical protein [Phycisphaerales bacterium]
MLNGTLLFACAALGCTVTFQADAGPQRNKRPPPPPPTADQIHSASDPVFVDWSYQTLNDPSGGRSYPANPRNANPDRFTEDFSYADKNIYVPMPQPGGAHGSGFSGSYSWLVRNSLKKVAQSGAPVVFMIRNRNCPFPYDTNGLPTSPNELREALDALPKLDYLFMDLEGKSNDITRNVREVVRLVRSHPNPQIANAYIGNYNDAAESYNEAIIWEAQRNRESVGPTRWNQSRFYINSGMNVSMPIAYPYETYSVHTSVSIQKSAGATPNDRAAMLWTPIERVSASARALPSGHKLVPWVSNYISFDDDSRRSMYHAAPQNDEDQAALIQHLRLRGANGFAVFAPQTNSTRHPQLNYKRYRKLAIDAWASLDEAFEGSTSFEVLNLETTKRTGVVWSGIRSGNTVAVLVSNLSGNGQSISVTLPAVDGLPAATAAVRDGTHKLFTYQVAGTSTSTDQGDSSNQSNHASSGTTPTPVLTPEAARVSEHDAEPQPPAPQSATSQPAPSQTSPRVVRAAPRNARAAERQRVYRNKRKNSSSR